MQKLITILFKPTRINLMYSLYPFWTSKYSSLFSFSENEEWVLKKDRNRFVLLVGWFDGREEPAKRILFLEKLKKKYDKVFFFDTNDGSESHYLDLMPYIDKYYKKQVFVDKSNYSKSFYGNRIFTDFYHKNFGIVEEKPKEPLPVVQNQNDLEKISVLWNLGIGQYPLSKPRNFIAKKGVKFLGKSLMSQVFSKKSFLQEIPSPLIEHCQARFGYSGYRETVGYQRKIFIEILKQHPLFLTGLIPSNEYKKELKNVKAVFSPFGWGEICFRDFEAIISGAVLIKPDVSHIQTWPNIYVPNKTYIPVKWDGSDIIEKTEELFRNPTTLDKLRKEAWLIFNQSYKDLDHKVMRVITDFGLILD